MSAAEIVATLGKALDLASSIHDDMKEGRSSEAERKREYLRKALDAFDRGDLSGVTAALAGMPIPGPDPRSGG